MTAGERSCATATCLRRAARLRKQRLARGGGRLHAVGGQANCDHRCGELDVRETLFDQAGQVLVEAGGCAERNLDFSRRDRVAAPLGFCRSKAVW
ncbi:hypothetical protein WJ64_15065 [Burkholderia ubonensis]|nr:hypothetical protein WJ64_15065 [Burkholderia ubonensis]